MKSLSVPTFVSLKHIHSQMPARHSLPPQSQQLPARQGLVPAFACLLDEQRGIGRRTGCPAVQSTQPGMGMENADGEETALKN